MMSAAHADVFSADYYQQLEVKAQALAAGKLQLPWQVGDTANYNVKLGPISGTVDSSITEETGEGFWVVQNVDLMFQKQKIEILFDKETGEILQMKVNGEKQSIPENNMEVVDMQDDKVTVPAGTFDVLHVTLRDKTSGDESHAWVNPNIIPISGAAKQTSPSQFGQVVMELKSFVKN